MAKSLGYADPPYPNCAHLYKDHPDKHPSDLGYERGSEDWQMLIDTQEEMTHILEACK